MEKQTNEFTEEKPLASDDNNIKETVQQNLASTTEIQAWIVSYIAELLEIEPDQVDATIPFDRYGLDSSAAIGMTGDLEECLGYEVDPTLIYDYPTIKALAEHLSEDGQAKE